MAEIGTTLREARIRARIDISEIEAKTKIRAKYLRALENEEWGLLPGPTYIKSFLRTYAQALGLDGRALVEEYKAQFERGEEWESRYPPVRSRRRPERERLSRGWLVATVVLALIALLAVIGSLSGSSREGAGQSRRLRPPAIASTTHSLTTTATKAVASTSVSAVTTLELRPTARVWVCLIAEGRKLIPGEILEPAEAETPVKRFHARAFKLNLGDSHVVLSIDGHKQAVPPSAEPIGYAIEGGSVRTLAAAERPTCA